MALKSWTCTECNEKFEVGKWECAPGQRHQVALKEYYLDDAPTDKSASSRDMANSRTHVHNIPPERVVEGEHGQAVKVPGGSVTFARGYYATTDPEQQFYLDKAGIGVSKERWMQFYYTEAERLQLKQIEVKNTEALLNQRLQEANTLLAKTQAEVKAKKPELAATK